MKLNQYTKGIIKICKVILKELILFDEISKVLIEIKDKAQIARVYRK